MAERKGKGKKAKIVIHYVLKKEVTVPARPFIGFSPDVARIDLMLRRMVGLEDGVRDRLTDFTRSTGGALYVTPPVEAFAG